MKRLLPILLILLSLSSLSACYGKSDILSDGTFPCKTNDDCLTDDDFKCLPDPNQGGKTFCKLQEAKSSTSCNAYDEDGDGFPKPSTPKDIRPSCGACINGNTDVCTGKISDCDDTQKLAFPGNKGEYCSGIDNNCNGKYDADVFKCPNPLDCDANISKLVPNKQDLEKNGDSVVAVCNPSEVCEFYLKEKSNNKCYKLICPHAKGKSYDKGSSVACP